MRYRVAGGVRASCRARGAVGTFFVQRGIEWTELTVVLNSCVTDPCDRAFLSEDPVALVDSAFCRGVEAFRKLADLLRRQIRRAVLLGARVV